MVNFVKILFIKARIHSIEILRIQPILRYAQSFTEPLIMHDLAFSQELERLAHVGVIDQANKVIVGDARLLLCYYHVLATKSWCVKVRKILILQGFTALFG